MNESPQHFLRPLLPAWLSCMLLSLPAVLFWHSHDGRFIALCSFFVGGTSFVVCAFRRDIIHPSTQMASVEFPRPKEAWRKRMLFVGLALCAQWAVFSVLCLVFNDAHDIVAPVLALLALIPSLCIAPYLTLATGKPFAAVVLTLFLVGCMKMVAGSVTVLVHGWHASEFGHTNLTWTHPNLIVCTLVVATAILSGAFYVLGMRRFHSIYGRAA